MTGPVSSAAATAKADISAQCAVSILIVAYNSVDLIGACLDSIPPACTRHDYEVLLVDNGDGATETLVRNAHPDIRIVESKGNVGFAAGNNWLAHHARSDRLLLLNPDMVLEPGAIDALIAATARHPQAAAWGGVTVDAGGTPDSGNAIAMPSLLEFASAALGRSIVGNSRAAGLNRDAAVEVLVGGFVMFDRAAWEQVGGFDERYFLYCEEVDLFYRLTGLGYRFWRIPAARGHHAIAHGQGLSPLRMLYRAAGTAEFVRRHWSPLAGALGRGLVWLAALERVIAGRLLGRWRPRLRAMAGGYRDVALRPGLWIHGYDPKRGLLARLDRDRA
ncbi:glycosyltransferase family 2 protein [Erythrobacter sp. JK5]|uniref:glycosyltransferase family 2 protein n=1 Tax=Erythrobacter sp. JK5 TaxID=2829500 RepID=UPI001BABC241|nr:glycosyltransferase family 2 protein [Erythrobacter sp. JK5]QUL37672.1 glycosyltransferase family 2 protein [Erythrobacter sp. JK5]